MRRYRIGLIGASTNVDYPRALRLGIQNTVEEAGHTVVHIADLIPYHTLTNAEAYVRVAVEIVSRLELDAVIYPAGCVAAYLTGDSAKSIELLGVLDPAHTLVIEREVSGYRCVNKDNAPGMHECMRHLIETCGFTRIAFVSGPPTSRGAHERETIYFEEMEAHGLATPPSMFARSTFGGGAPEIIGRILDENPDVEAIVCACDLIAYDAYVALNQRGLHAGSDVAVTGFDDHERSRHMDPPLSTVHMTAYDYGCMAAREALRMCDGLPQEEYVINSTFIARGSCGENMRGGVDVFCDLLARDPFPADELVDIVMDSTLSMAGAAITKDFRARMATFFDKVRSSYRYHLAHPDEEVLLFSSQDLSVLFARSYREYLSLEGFHSVAIALLEALIEVSHGDDAVWVIEQISHLHLRIARMLDDTSKTRIDRINKREWMTFHMADSALRENGRPDVAYQLMLEQLGQLGVRQADLFVLPEPVEFIGARTFALSDVLKPIGRLANGAVEVLTDQPTLSLQRIVPEVLARYDDDAYCTIGGLMAGNELVGIAVFDAGELSDNAQLMALLNLGFAIKYLQAMVSGREMNKLLNHNNLLLRHESQHDEMTGLLNRRGFMNQADRRLRECAGSSAAIVFMDLDGLKTINDTLGHDMGDEAIRETAQILVRCFSSDDLVCRLGGDEFVALTLADGDIEARQITDAIQRAMDDYNDTHDRPYVLSISCGIASFVVDANTTPPIDELMVQADERLYEMKRKRKASRRYEG